jgi:hypothetical protein
MNSQHRFLIAYHRTNEGILRFLPVVPSPGFDPETEPQRIEEWFGQMHAEGGIAAQVFDGDTLLAEREFPFPEQPGPIVYMVTHPSFAASPFAATLVEISRRFVGFTGVFAATWNGVVAVGMEGPVYIGLPVELYRERTAGAEAPGAPICFPGDFIPHDGVFIEIGKYHRAYVRTSDDPGGFRVIECWRHVIPHVAHRPLWTIWGIDRFLSLGEDIAMEAAQTAIALARYGFDYGEIEHYQAVASKSGRSDGTAPSPDPAV